MRPIEGRDVGSSPTEKTKQRGSMRNLYHYKLGIPSYLKLRFGVIRLRYGQHSMDKAYERAGKIFKVPTLLDTDKAQVIEVEETNRITTKVVYRVPFDSREDLCIVVIPQTNQVKTVWLNCVDDKHYTLNERPYTKV